MYASLRDRNPDVFLSTTILDIPFVYDGDTYYSVLECYNDRKILPTLWDPATIPEFHRLRLWDAIGFLNNRETGECFTFDYDINNRDFLRHCKQFKLCVCSMLFVAYYKHVMSTLNYLDKTKVISRYGDIYNACMKLCNAITLKVERYLLMKYDLTEDKVDWCNIVFEEGKQLPDRIEMPKCHSIRMSVDTFKALSAKGYSWVNKFPKDVPIVIACETKEAMDDYYWVLVRAGGYEPNLVAEYVGYEGGFTVFLSTTDNKEVLNAVNWHRAYVCGVRN